MKIYRSKYINKKTLEEFEPFYIIHKAKNKIDAKRDGQYYLWSYWHAKGSPPKFLNELNKKIQIRITTR